MKKPRPQEVKLLLYSFHEIFIEHVLPATFCSKGWDQVERNRSWTQLRLRTPLQDTLLLSGSLDREIVLEDGRERVVCRGQKPDTQAGKKARECDQHRRRLLCASAPVSFGDSDCVS